MIDPSPYPITPPNNPTRQDEQHDEIFKKILASPKHLAFPRGLDPDAADLVRKLLNPNPAFRLGALEVGSSYDAEGHPRRGNEKRTHL